jgi:hypothetical protein
MAKKKKIDPRGVSVKMKTVVYDKVKAHTKATGGKIGAFVEIASLEKIEKDKSK